jgi:hypothetical protein
MPDTGFELEPISPVSRDETVTNRNPHRMIMIAPARFMWRLGAK